MLFMKRVRNGDIIKSREEGGEVAKIFYCWYCIGERKRIKLYVVIDKFLNRVLMKNDK